LVGCWFFLLSLRLRIIGEKDNAFSGLFDLLLLAFLSHFFFFLFFAPVILSNDVSFLPRGFSSILPSF